MFCIRNAEKFWLCWRVPFAYFALLNTLTFTVIYFSLYFIHFLSSHHSLLPTTTFHAPFTSYVTTYI